MEIMKKERLDLMMLNQSLVSSRAQAQGLIMAGQVLVNGKVVDKSGSMIALESAIEIVKKERFVSRGGEKLAGALEEFKFSPSGLVCADVGSSTGGFTDCLLQAGALRVYCIDVGKGILHWKLRNDPRVVVLEESNARNVELLPEQVDLVVCDASFISLRILLPVFKGWLKPNADIITLIKPQFEAGKAEVARGKGVIRDPKVHQHVLTELLEFNIAQGFNIMGLVRSSLIGPKGNVEFLLWATNRAVKSRMDHALLIQRLFTGNDQKEEK